METLDQILGVYTLDRATVHLAVASVVVLAVIGLVAAIRVRNAAYRAGLDASEEMLRRDFGTWRDGYTASGLDYDDERLDLIETIGIDVLGVYRSRHTQPRPTVTMPPPPPPSDHRPLNFGD